jgi:hypothetical protein
MSYGPDWGQMYGIAADYVDRILKGAKPAELPVQQPTTLKLLINPPRRQSIWRCPQPCSRAPTRLSSERRDVRYWHKADMGLCAAHVCF